MAFLKKLIFLSLSLFYGNLSLLMTIFNVIRYRAEFFKVKRRDTPPQVLSDPELGTHHYVTLASGIKIHYVANGNSNKPMMLLLHGFPEFWYSWRYQLKAFKSDFWVVAPDLRGYGDSDKPNGVENYTTQLIVKDVKELIEALGKEKVILVCHDWGGAIGWQFASSYPNYVEKLIALNAPHPTHFNKILSQSWKQFLKSWYIFFFQLPYLPEIRLLSQDLKFFDSMFTAPDGTIFVTKDSLEAYKYTFAKPGAFTPPINWYRAIPKNPQVKMNTITMPTLVIWGEKDVALVPEVGSGVSKYVEDFNFQLVEEGSHFIQTHKPDIVNRHIKDFLGLSD